MKNFFIMNTYLEYHTLDTNKGGEAVILTTIKILKKMFPDAGFTTSIKFLKAATLDEAGCEYLPGRTFEHKHYSPLTTLKSSLELLAAYIWKVNNRLFKADLSFLLFSRKLKAIKKSDAVIEIAMDVYSDDFGLRTVLEITKEVITAKYLGKPVEMWALSTGPFRKKSTRFLAKWAFGSSDIITIREEASRNNMNELGPHSYPVHLTADPAFVLDPSPADHVKELLVKHDIDIEKKPIIGFTLPDPFDWGRIKQSSGISFWRKGYQLVDYLFPDSIMDVAVKLLKMTGMKMLNNKNEGFIRDMHLILDHLVEKYDATCLVITHIDEATPLMDINQVAHEVCETSRNRDSLRLIPSSYTTYEHKALIGICDMHVGGKMHANIAALSQGIPSVGISYGHKFKGIAALFGMEKYISETAQAADVIERIDAAWQEIEENRERIKGRLPEIMEMAMLNGKLLKDLMEPEVQRHM